jgi:senataxin
VIFCTLSTSGSAVVRRQLRSVDVLLVDEAGQASEGELVIPLFLRPLNLVLVGDPQQLPPTILSTENARLGWNVSSMERLMRHLDAPHRLLDTQYRMHPQISCFPNRQFYAGRLNDSEHVRTAVRPDFGCDDGSAANCVPGCFGSPFLFLDVKGLEQGGSRRGVSCSISNPAEATLVIKLCVSLCKSILDARGRSGCGDGGDLPQIRILTFYSAQVKVLKAQHQAAVVKEHASPLARYLDSIRVHSVDSFQGSEADCVLVSFVRSNAAQRVGFLKDFQRLNVALTRAKHLLLAVGDAATLGGTPLASTPAKNVEPDSDSLAALIKHCKQQRLLVDGAGLF